MSEVRAPTSARARRAGAALLVGLLALAGCGSVPVKPGSGQGASSGGKASAEASGARAPGASRGGAFYLDDGPGDNPPPDLHAVPDAVPRAEPLHPYANRPYRVFGVAYVPRPGLTEHRERGVASWYGRKFHGRRTSSGEPYDMYAMTAAHPTLPIPSYVRVTHVRNGRSVVVRVNDRGPFLHRRVIDLSYTAAYRLGYLDNGHAEVEVELLTPSGGAREPVQAAVRADVAPAPAEVAAPAPMLAEAVAAERLSLETLVDDRPVAGAASAGAAPAAAAVAGTVAASAASTKATPASAASSAADERTTWLQIGAFASRGNAEAARARFAREAPWLPVPVDVLRQGDTWRVQVGPWTSREDALAAAARIASNGAFRPIPVVR